VMVDGHCVAFDRCMANVGSRRNMAVMRGRGSKVVGPRRVVMVAEGALTLVRRPCLDCWDGRVDRELIPCVASEVH
jgi:hypothetical protein